MLDQAAVGTAINGLRAVRREQQLYDAFVPQPRRKGWGVAIRSSVAQALRHVADSLEASQRSARPSRA